MSASPVDASRAIRQKIIAERRALGPERVARLSEEIVRRFVALSGLGPDQLKDLHVALYQALPSELSLLALEEELVRSGATLYFPRVRDAASRELEFVAVEPGQLLTAERAHQAWQQGPYGIHEPHPSLLATDGVRFDLVFVPGVAFGLSGERIGMGGGFYDRFLARIPDAIRVVLAFDFQLQDRLAQAPWDQPVDWIITERREVRRPRAQAWLDARAERP